MNDLMERMRQLAGIVESRPMYRASLTESVSEETPLSPAEVSQLFESLSVDELDVYCGLLEQELAQLLRDTARLEENPERYAYRLRGREMLEAAKGPKKNPLIPPDERVSPAAAKRTMQQVRLPRGAPIEDPHTRGDIAVRARHAIKHKDVGALKQELKRLQRLRNASSLYHRGLKPGPGMDIHVQDYEKRMKNDAGERAYPDASRDDHNRLAARASAIHGKLAGAFGVHAARLNRALKYFKSRKPFEQMSTSQKNKLKDFADALHVAKRRSEQHAELASGYDKAAGGIHISYTKPVLPRDQYKSQGPYAHQRTPPHMGDAPDDSASGVQHRKFHRERGAKLVKDEDDIDLDTAHTRIKDPALRAATKELNRKRKQFARNAGRAVRTAQKQAAKDKDAEK